MKLGDFVRNKREWQEMSQEAVAKAAGLGRNTVFNLENNAPIRIDNLRKICLSVLSLSQEDWKTILTLWLRELLGDDFDLYAVEQAAVRLHAEEQNATESAEERLLKSFRMLDEGGRTEILKAIQRPEMIENIRALNALYDTLRAS